MAIPVLILGISLADLALRARRHDTVLATNLPTPPNSSGDRVVDLVVAGPSSRVAEIRFRGLPDLSSEDFRGGHLELQAWGAGKTRVLVVRRGAGDGGRIGALRDVLGGAASLQVVPECGWIDVGSLPFSEQEPVQIIGLLPGEFSFALPIAGLSAQASAPTIELRRADLGLGPETVPAPRFRIVRRDPVPAGELFARLIFFVQTSRILGLALACAVVAIIAGFALLARGADARATWFLVAGPVLLHASLLPPLQGADETSQAGTIEAALWNPAQLQWNEKQRQLGEFPQSVTLISRALEQDRVQHHPGEALPVGSASQRMTLARLLGDPLAEAASTTDAPPFGAFLQRVDLRAPAYYQLFPMLGPVLLGSSMSTRLAVYRLLPVSIGLLLVGLAFLLLRRLDLDSSSFLVLSLVLLLPYSVGTLATSSNYGPAIGVGAIVAVAACGAILRTGRARRLSCFTLLGASVLGPAVWPDFLMLSVLVPLVVGAAVASSWSLGRREPSDTPNRAARRTIRILLLLGSAVALLGITRALALGQVPAVVRRLLNDDPLIAAVAIAAPLGVACLDAGLCLAFRDSDQAQRLRIARRTSLVVALLFVVGFVVTPFTRINIETEFLPLPRLAWSFVRVTFSNAFSWDQDRLFWKFFVGVFGWHDTFYPDAIYMLFRLAFVLFLIIYPILCVPFTTRAPRASALLALVGGGFASLCVTTLILRHAMLVHPHGRFALPWLPALLLPILLRTLGSTRGLLLRWLVGSAVALQIWTAVTVIGARYTLGQ